MIRTIFPVVISAAAAVIILFASARAIGAARWEKRSAAMNAARGELMRYLSEAAWYPTALLPGQGVQWQPLDGSSASATLTDGEIQVTMLFRFDDSGLIESVYSEGRERLVKDSSVLTPWEGRFSTYQSREGMLIPVSGEVLWLLPEGEHSYWEGIIDAGLHDAGLTAKQLFMLSLMEREFESPPSISALAEAAFTSHQNVMQMARSLERRGFVTLQEDPADRRIKRVSLTRTHHEFWSRRGEEDTARLEELFEPLSEPEKQTLKALLDRLVPAAVIRYEERKKK